MQDLSEAREFDLEFQGFKSPAKDDTIFFSSLVDEGKPFAGTMVVEVATVPETFMGNLQTRVKLDNIYAAAALQEIEKKSLMLFEKLPQYKKQNARSLCYNELITMKLKESKTGGWAFTTNDKAFTPTKLNKISVGTKLDIAFTLGFYYTEENCGLYLTLKNLNFQKKK